MQLNSILSPGRTLCGVPGSSKKRIFQYIAQFISEEYPILDADDLFDQLMARERLGSTALGQGIAIPHCRIKNCQEIIGSLIKLSEPVDFDAIDGQPVDLLFVLLVPDQANEEHLSVLAMLAEKFSTPEYCQQLRKADNNEALFQNALG